MTLGANFKTMLFSLFSDTNKMRKINLVSSLILAKNRENLYKSRVHFARAELDF